MIMFETVRIGTRMNSYLTYTKSTIKQSMAITGLYVPSMIPGFREQESSDLNLCVRIHLLSKSMESKKVNENDEY